MTTEAMCRDIVLAIRDLCGDESNDKAGITFSPDWGGNSVTLTFMDGGHTHVGTPGITDEEFIEALHAQCEGGAMSAPDFRVRRVVRLCPRCRIRRVHVQRIYEWYDPDHTCLTCGQSWTHDWMYPRGREEERTRHIARARAWLKAKCLRYRGLRFVKGEPVLR